TILFSALFVSTISHVVEKFVCIKKAKNNSIIERPFDKKTYNVLYFVCGLFVSYISFTNYSFIHALFITVFAYISCVVTTIDNRIRIIPNEIVVVMFFLGLILRFIDGGFISVLYGFISMFAVFVIFMVTLAVTKGFVGGSKVGAGDLKLMMVVALASGYPNILYSISAMAIAMLVFIILSLMSKTLTLRSTFPMAGFIVFGLMIGLLNEVVWV
ncbi:MAG: prepilin peptidase, partial [Bacillota bacterium]|nr:prepilin peptidase [Bacillota bacterium]